MAVRWALIGVAMATLGAIPAAYGLGSERDTADVARALTLLNVVGEEYREGVADGAVVLPVEYAESQAFLDEAESRVRSAAPDVARALQADFAALRAALVARAPLDQVRRGLDTLRAAISQRTGVVEAIYPAEPPSAAHGRQLFAENWSPCHGAHADGQGPNAAKLTPRPANFTDAEFMARETPFSFFNIITAGKGTAAMPAWGDVFTLQERWDLVSFLYTVRADAARLAAGQGIYLRDCAGCHGASGDGRGAQSAQLRTPVAQLNAPATLAERTDEQIVAAIADGVPSASMPGYADRLTDAQLRAVADYVRLLSLGGPATAAVASEQPSGRRFVGLLRLLDDQYRKAMPSGAPANEGAIVGTTILLDQVRGQVPTIQAALAERDATLAAALPQQVDRIAAAVRDRRPVGEVAALTGPLTRSLEAQFPDEGAVAPDAVSELADAQRLLDQALAAYRAGDPRAVYLVSDAYFIFDPLEKKLALRDPALAARAEGRFAELRGVLATPGNDREAAALVAALSADLAQARATSVPPADPYSVLFQSAFVILREGFEVVLVIGALLAYVRKAGLPRMRTSILWGTGVGVLASVLSWYVLERIVVAAGATSDVIEGTTMLLAAAVLFFVSYWLISKAEAERWQRYIQGKVKAALASGNALALAGAAFLAVYREGVETILFYKALVDSSGGAFATVAAGVALGACGLAVVYVLYQRLGSRLPMRQFFLVTGALLYYLAVVFAGKGVAELQAAGWISTTPLRWVPRIEFIGLFPTLETVIAQGALLLCVAYAVVVTLRRSRQAEAASASLAVKAASHRGA